MDNPLDTERDQSQINQYSPRRLMPLPSRFPLFRGTFCHIRQPSCICDWGMQRKTSMFSGSVWWLWIGKRTRGGFLEKSFENVIFFSALKKIAYNYSIISSISEFLMISHECSRHNNSNYFHTLQKPPHPSHYTHRYSPPHWYVYRNPTVSHHT